MDLKLNLGKEIIVRANIDLVDLTNALNFQGAFEEIFKGEGELDVDKLMDLSEKYQMKKGFQLVVKINNGEKKWFGYDNAFLLDLYFSDEEVQEYNEMNKDGIKQILINNMDLIREYREIYKELERI